jgi:predicted transcriptional regulator
MQGRHRISAGLSKEEYMELSALAKKHRISLAWLGRQAVAEFLERYRERDVQPPLFVSPRVSTGE